MNTIVNITAYRFVTLAKDELPKLRLQILHKAQELQLKGTVLLAEEGINLYVAGSCSAIEAFKDYLNGYNAFKDLFYKENILTRRPYRRMLVKIKKEIITFNVPKIRPEQHTAPHLAPEEFKSWYEQGKDMIVLDTRNDYEVRLGTFANAVDLKIKHFRHFPKAVSKLKERVKDKPVVTFCTGGIRCEKAAEYMLQQGFKEVYQLDGGIINYFQQCGGEHYQGECFVFDGRVAINPQLKETDTVQCFSCRMPLKRNEQFELVGECPYCHDTANNQG